MVLEIRDLLVYRGGLRLEVGELVVRAKTVLLGRNGTGKSTLLKSLTGLIKPVRGEILVNGRDITGLPVEDRPLGYIPQRIVKLPMNPRSQLEYFSKLHGRDYRPIISSLRLERLLEKRGLSVGELQLLAIATTLLKDPEILLMDEPCANLDWPNKKLVLQLVRTLEIPVLYVTHDPLEALFIAHEVALLEDGRLVGIYPNKEKEIVEEALKHYDLYERLKASRA